MDKLHYLDTNVLLESPELLTERKIVVLSHVVRELEKHKLSFNKDLAYKARRATRFIEEHKDQVVFDFNDYQVKFDNHADANYVDNKILQACLDNDRGLITFDLLLKFKAKGLGIEVIEAESNFNDDRDYSGVKEILIDINSPDDFKIMDEIENYSERNSLKLVKNEYLVIWDKQKPTYDEDGEPNGYESIGVYKFDGFKVQKAKFKPIKNSFTDTVKPINVKQKLAFDMMQDDSSTIKMITGGFGVGKDFIMISHAVNMLMTQKFKKLVWVRNNIDVKDVPEIGFLPDGLEAKLKPYYMILADHLGGEDGLMHYIASGKIEIQHLGHIRGRDFKDTILYCTESQNLTKDHVKLLIGRVGQGSQLWLNGDLQQSDSDKIKSMNGIDAIKQLKGHRLYAQVTLDKTERSETAELASLID